MSYKIETKLKRSLSMLMCVILIAGLIPITAQAVDPSDILSSYGGLPGFRDISTTMATGDIPPIVGSVPVAGFGKALSFDGTNENITVPSSASIDFSGSSDLTISMWVFRKSSNAATLYCQLAYGGQFKMYTYLFQDGRLRLAFNCEGLAWDIVDGSTTGKPVIPLNKWCQITVTKAGSLAKAYVDGELYSTLNLSSNTTSAVTSTQNIEIGSGGTFNGYLDNVQIFNTALDQDTIRNLMYSEIDATYPSYANLQLYYKFNEGSGTTAYDFKGTNNGTMQNMDASNWVDSTIRDWTTNEDTPFTGYLVGSDIEGAGSLTYQIVNPGTIGTAVLSGGNQFTYTPDADANGSDTFTYKVRDINGNESNIQSVSIAICAVNDAPTASNVRISGIAQKDNILTGGYSYNDLEGDAQGTSTFKWYRSDDGLGTGKTAISGALSATYIVTADDVGKYLSFEVTPIASSGMTNGTAVESGYTSAVALNGYFAGGDGSAGNPYQIASALQLELMAEKVNGDLAASYASKYYILTADIVMPTVAAGQSNHTAIGSKDNYWFKGSFDGQNHSISGIKIDRPSEDDQGLFDYVYSGAVVKNVRIINSGISGKGWVGGVVSFNSGKLENCSYSGTVKGGLVAGEYAGMDIGGIAGLNNEGQVINCINSASVTTGVGATFNGGIIGGNYGIVRNCYNSGNITAGYDSSIIGGIVGNNAIGGKVLNNYNTGTVAAYGSVGGIVGYNFDLVQNNYSTGAVSSAPIEGIIGGGVHVGGIEGSNDVNDSPYYGTIKNNYWLKNSTVNTSINGLGDPGGVYNSCASFSGTGGALTPVAGHTVIESKTNLIDALNAWTAAENNKSPSAYLFWKAGASYPVFTPPYAITVSSGILNGSVTVNKTAAEGQTVAMTPAPAEGYRLVLGSVKVTYNGSTECLISAGENDTYTFTMPAYPVSITAEYEIIPFINMTLTSATGNYLTGVATCIDSGITVVSPLNITGGSVNINGFLPGDTLTFINSGAVTGSYNSSNGVLTISGAASAAVYQDFLRSIKFNTSSTSGTRTFEILLSNTSGNALYYSGTGHFYEYVSAATTWSGAKSAAESRSYTGVPGNGYLATITSAGENEFISEKLGSDAWIGASDAASEGTWRWVSGPEANHLLRADAPYYSNWAAGEPNNAGEEDYAEIYVATGKWNDLNGTQPYGYVVEYGYDYYNLSGSGAASKTITIVKADPIVSWSTAVEITYGQTFNDVISSFTANVDGTFSIEDAATVPAAGSYSKTITFTPADTANYNILSTTVSVTVNKADGVISDITCPDKTYDGNPLSPSATVTTGVGDIVYTYSGGEIVGSASESPSDAGTYLVTAALPASDNYNAAVKTKEVTISKAEQSDLVITDKPASTPVYGDVFTLGTSGGSGTGAITWSVSGGAAVTDGTVTINGMEEVTITATKVGDGNYNAASDTYTFTPGKATPTLGTITASSIFVGEGLFNSNLSRTDDTVAGVLEWEDNPSFDNSSAGNKSVTYSFTPTGVDAGRYNALTGQSVTVSVTKRNILSVSPQDAILDKSFCTTQEDLDLPATVSVTAQGTDGDVTRTIPVTWTGYNPNTLSTQPLTGTLDLTGNDELINSDSKRASISVTLQPLAAKSISNVFAKIKVGATDGTALLMALVTDQFDESVDTVATGAGDGWDEFPENYDVATSEEQAITVRVYFKYGYAPEYQDVNIVYEIVNPHSLSYTASIVPMIDATDGNNSSAAALLAYVNGYNALNATWDAEAVGTTTAANNAPVYTALPKGYTATGTVYNFAQTYLGHELTQSITVKEVRQEKRILVVDYDTERINTTSAMAYSTQDGVWKACTDDMSFSSWLGSTVTFKTVASGFKVDSETTEIVFPSREKAPASLTAIINDAKTEITVLGLTSDTAYEYSTDGAVYFDLSADGKITVSDYQNSVCIRKKYVTDVSVHSESATVVVKYTMTFNTGTDSTISPAYAVSGATVTEPLPLTRTGYTFDGWYISEIGAGSAIVFPYTMTGNLTVFAIWNINSSDDSSGPSDASVVINGETQIAGTSQTTTTDGQTVTTVTIDTDTLGRLLEETDSKPTVTIPVNTGADVIVGELSGQTVKNMETREAVLEITTGTVTYTLPASEINIDDVSTEMGAQVQLEDIKVSISIAKPSQDTVSIVEDTANKNSYQIVVKPIEFEITCTYGDKTVDVSHFSGYVERTVEIPDGIDPSKITTGIVLNADGTFSHVPTTIIVIDGKYYAKISSLTNSTYFVIYNPIKFSDVSNHWAKDAVNDMGSRLIVNGVGNGNYDPDSDITRAEFATIIIRALGLKAGIGENKFCDVRSTDWYCGYIEAAASYGIILGYSDGTFGPSDKITREQAMIMIERAMRLTGLNLTLTDSEIASLLYSYTDASDASSYAKISIAACLKAGVILGKGSDSIAPKDHITRAEVAVIVQRLLKKSNLI